MALIYDGGTTGSPSSIDKAGVGQLRQEFYDKQAVIDIQDETYLAKLSSTTNMPKNMGKNITKHRYIPLLDDENMNSQGLDLTGISALLESTIVVTLASGETKYFVGSGATDLLSYVAAAVKLNLYAEGAVLGGGLGLTITVNPTTEATVITFLAELRALTGSFSFVSATAMTDAVNTFGNLYGSSRDIGAINSKMPVLSETGGRVNRVGFTRKEITTAIVNLGYFFEWSKDSLNFDTDPELKMHLTREAVRGGAQINEDYLYMALVNGAGVNFFAGNATSIATVSGAVIATSAVPSYTDLLTLDVELTNNQCPRDTKVISGSRMVDTKVVQAARYMFISPDVVTSFRAMTDLHGNPAFKDVSEYSAANMDNKYVKAIHGEVGSVGPFRIVVHPKAIMREGATGVAGAAVTNNLAGLRETGGFYDVYPCLVVGSEAFTHVGFEFGAGTKGKFKTKTMTPEQNYSTTDPYGKTGFTSLEFWNGVLIERPEWLAVYNVGAKLY